MQTNLTHIHKKARKHCTQTKYTSYLFHAHTRTHTQTLFCLCVCFDKCRFCCFSFCGYAFHLPTFKGLFGGARRLSTPRVVAFFFESFAFGQSSSNFCEGILSKFLEIVAEWFAVNYLYFLFLDKSYSLVFVELRIKSYQINKMNKFDLKILKYRYEASC